MSKVWAIPMTITEYGREAIIFADTKADALRVFQARGWNELTDPSTFKITKVGPCRLMSLEDYEGGTR